MQFGCVALDEAVGAILARSIKTAKFAFKKGRHLSAADVGQLRAAGLGEVTVARLDRDDVPEDNAARMVADAACGPYAKRNAPFTGRCNLYALQPGVVLVDRARLDRLNLIDESITVATLAPFDLVEAGQMLATVKIIPFAVPRAAVEACAGIAADGEPLLRVAPLRAHRVGLVLTTLPGQKPAVVDKTAAVLADRLRRLGSSVAGEQRCPHEARAVADAIQALAAAGCAPILIYGASAIVDRRDVIPAAIVQAGGVVDHFGMPVDPGNLLLIGHREATAVVGLPGCARSPKLNGFDWVLWRLLADLPVSRADIMRMGAGGLLKDLPTDRGASRDGEDDDDGIPRMPRIAAIVLAAGRSSRMGANKLLADIDGRPMVSHVVDAVAKSLAVSTVVVTGHEADRVRAALGHWAVSVVHNPDFAAGLSGSLRAGLTAVGDDIDGVVIALGDMPAIKPEHLDRLIAAFNPTEGRVICVPTSGGKRGNPVLWSRAYFDEMGRLAGDVGARQMIADHADQVCEVPLDDPAIFLDLDTPQALDHYRKRRAGP
ncbi:MAG: 4-diphosphocytidyl-2C-methyl-D-erythritol kinase [Alphaproteobacteria bacterium]|nr:4-diphosphocytidyl-2C-methyl-D-erythritol kinase [Alphaproteobacteria bacterium]